MATSLNIDATAHIGPSAQTAGGTNMVAVERLYFMLSYSHTDCSSKITRSVRVEGDSRQPTPIADRLILKVHAKCESLGFKPLAFGLLPPDLSLKFTHLGSVPLPLTSGESKSDDWGSSVSRVLCGGLAETNCKSASAHRDLPK